MGARRLDFQTRTVNALSQALAALNIPLLELKLTYFDEVPAALLALCEAHQITHVDFIDEYPLNERRRDHTVCHVMAGVQVAVTRHVGDVIIAPGQLLTGEGKPYTVFTPFYKRWQQQIDAICAHTLPVPSAQARWPLDDPPNSVLSDDSDEWPAGEAAAWQLLETFLTEHAADYQTQRDLPAVPGTSRLSAYLAVGAISARTCVHAALQAMALNVAATEGLEKWVAELAWRDFYRHIVAQFDHVSRGEAFRQPLDQLRWRDDPDALAAWQTGQTGYPLVDAAMRQLNQTGWMHNRLRMVAAMFLSKHLLLDWRAGERYFMQQLVDGDFASNNGGWQWSASTGTDAAPYFRIFNPASQGQRYDAQGEFTRQYVPELETVPSKHLFEPHKVGVAGYPAPIVDHKQARERALAFFKANA